MKKKVLAFLLASTMVIEPFSVASAADFSDGMGQDTVQFSDDVEDVAEVENDDVDQFGTDAVGEGESSSKPSEDAIQMGNDVWVTFDDSTGTATISGTGDMWDYYENGYDYTNKYQNPFIGKSGIKKIIVENGVTTIGNYLLQGYNNKDSIEEVRIEGNITKIGNYAFDNCSNLAKINFKEGINEIGRYAFENCEKLETVVIPDTVKTLGKYCFSRCYALSKLSLSNSLKDIPERAFLYCQNIDGVLLPEKLESIGDGAFCGCSSIQEIVFPASIKSMGEISFADCEKLENVVFEEGVTGNLSFQMFRECNKLESIVVPKSITSIEVQAFLDCKNLATVVVMGNTTRVSNPFEQCPNLRTIKGYSCSYIKQYYDSLSKDQKDQITFEAFEGKLHQWSTEKEVIKEPTCTEKGIKANKCNICGVIDESSKEEIPAYDHKWDGGVITKQATETEEGVRTYTCRRCNETKTESIPKLSKINFTISQWDCGWNNYYQYTLYCDVDKTVKYYTVCVKAGDEIPTYDKEKQDGVISSGGTYINVSLLDEEMDIYVFVTDDDGNYTYAKTTPNYSNRPHKPIYKVGKNVNASINGDTLILTGNGETYNEGSFEKVNKNSIKHIVVEDGITSIGQELFYNFKNIKTVILPNSLKRIDTWAFTYCQSLESIVIPEGVTEMGVDVFDGCSGLKSISLPSTLRIVPCLGELNGSDISGLPVENITLNNGIETIGERAFQDMNNLKTIIIPDSVTSIEDNAFNNCSVLTNLVLPDSITTIGNAAFSGCTSLEKIVLPSKLTSLGNVAFGGCNAEIIFPSSLKSIPELGSNAVKKVTIPEGVETIGYQAFCSCSNLTEITLPSTITSIESEAFEGTGITSFNYPQNITNIPNGAFANTNLTEFSVPEKVTEIDDNAFYNCYDLAKISIPKSVTYIGTDAFRNCRNLTIYGFKDSAAESYAKANNIKFVSADYKVIFKDNGRTKKTEYVTKGQNATPPTLDAKAGYTLSWDADYTNITEDMVINAVWTKKDNGGGNTTIIVSPSETNKYTVTFKDRGKIVKTEKVKSGDAAEYPYISRNGYELSWDKDFSKVTANITVNAVWTVIKPNKVTSLTAEVQKNSIDLSWDRAENTDYYLVYRKATSDTEYKQIKKTTQILWTDEDVEPGTEYSYKVVGVCSVDGKKYQGADSDIVTAKIGAPQIGDVYSVGDLKYKVTGAKEVSVIGLAKEEVEIKIPSAVSISGKAYKVTSIQAKAFYQNEDIVSIAIGNNVTYVGKYAFYQCPNLETVKFGKRVSVISTCAFTQCKNLENLTLPSSIRRIGAKAFYQCTSIKILKINGSTLEYVGKKGLAVNKSVTLRLPKKVFTKYQKLIKASSIYSKTKFMKF